MRIDLKLDGIMVDIKCPKCGKSSTVEALSILQAGYETKCEGCGSIMRSRGGMQKLNKALSKIRIDANR